MGTVFSSVLGKARDSIVSGRLFSDGERVLCALSGGADSVCLLVVLKELSSELNIKVYAAHLNHGIRGGEAQRDEDYCVLLCERLGIELAHEKADVPGEAKKRGMGLEECAREIRYEFLNRAAKSFGCSKICTAHHADDNIETVLLHMIRGCGMTGLEGISPVRGNIVRPLLALRKAELVSALDEIGVSYVHDSTNDETDCTRNYIRHNVLPHIYKINESADKAFYKMCSSVAESNAFILEKLEEIPKNASRAELGALHGALLSRYISLRYEEFAGEGRRLEYATVKLISDAVRSGKGTQRYDVTGGVTVYINHSGIQFEKSGKDKAGDFLFPLEYGENIISPIGYRILITTDKKVADEWKNIYKLSILWSVKFDKISKDGKIAVFVRNRRIGDRYVFGKMERDVRRQLINFKIPVQKRDTLPCFCTEEGLFGVYGLPLSDGMKAAKGENTAYIVCAEEN